MRHFAAAVAVVIGLAIPAYARSYAYTELQYGGASTVPIGVANDGTVLIAASVGLIGPYAGGHLLYGAVVTWTDGVLAERAGVPPLSIATASNANGVVVGYVGGDLGDGPDGFVSHPDGTSIPITFGTKAIRPVADHRRPSRQRRIGVVHPPMNSCAAHRAC